MCDLATLERFSQMCSTRLFTQPLPMSVEYATVALLVGSLRGIVGISPGKVKVKSVSVSVEITCLCIHPLYSI